ncbi:MAG: hypothetical protein FWG66_12250 [Spirochaetes bacterium]|nr:hypothetical protein [Spirochaetota bacterium]
MRKISKKIAVLLVVVMLAFSFNGCLSYVGRGDPTLHRVGYAIVDIIFLPISLIALVVYLIINDAGDETGVQMHLANSDNLFEEYYFLLARLFSLPPAELASVMQVLDSIPDAKRASSTERVFAMSETDRASLFSAYNSLPEAEILSSVERISALSQAELASLLQDFISLSESELNALVLELKSLAEPLQVALTGYPQGRRFGLQF